jgi:hypothetical protein
VRKIVDEIKIPYRQIKNHKDAALLFEYYWLYLKCNINYEEIKILHNKGSEERKTAYFLRRQALHFKNVFQRLYKEIKG